MKYSEIVCAVPDFLARTILEAGVSAGLWISLAVWDQDKDECSVLEKMSPLIVHVGWSFMRSHFRLFESNKKVIYTDC